jgi:hypothetical protein
VSAQLSTQIITVVKLPISEIEEWLRTKHDLPDKLDTFRIEDNNLVLNFVDNTYLDTEISSVAPLQVGNTLPRKRRSRKKRNRMKTRGWPVIARIVNSKNQKCAIYKPFVDALQGKQMSLEEQRRTVENILKSNRNRPTDESIQYFLENTLEYLKGVG